jgi:hypothetical protein
MASPNISTVIQQTLGGHDPSARAVATPSMGVSAFQWPWAIASAGANNLAGHTGAIDALASGGSGVVKSSDGPSIVAAVSGGPTNAANTNKVLNDGIFSQAINGVKADQLLRTMFIGWSSGAQIGLFGGNGGSGVAYDIIDRSNTAGINYGSFNLGIGGQVTIGLLVGAMTAQPRSLNDNTCVWQFGASIVGIGALVSVIMKSSDLSLIGFTLNLGGGVGISSSVGYGGMSAS